MLDMRHNIVIEHVKKNGGAFSTFENIATEAQLGTANSICPEAICVGEAGGNSNTFCFGSSGTETI